MRYPHPGWSLFFGLLVFAALCVVAVIAAAAAVFAVSGMNAP